MSSPDDAALGRASRGAALNLVGAAVATISGFGAVAVVTNAHGAAGAGVFFAAVALYTLSGNAAKLGTESGLTYLIARLRVTGDVAAIRTVVRSAAIAVGLCAAVVAIVGLAVAGVLADALTDEPGRRDDMAVMLRVLSLGVPAWSLSQVLAGATRGFATMRPSVLSGQIIRPLGQFVLVIAVTVASDELWPLAVAWVLGALAAVVPVALWVQRRVSVPSASERSADSEAAARAELWTFSRPRAASDLIHAALERLDVVLVSGIVGPAGAGIYGAANRVILAGQLVMSATAQAAAPQLSRDFADDDDAAAAGLIRSMTGWNVTLLWPVFAIVMFGAPAILPLLGDDFIAAENSLIVLGSAMIVIIGLGVGDLALLMTGNAKASLVNHVVALVAMLALALSLLPSVGVIGAAWAWAGSRILLRGLSLAWVWRSRGVHPFGTKVLGAAALVAVVWLPAALAHRSIDGSSLSVLAVVVAVGLGAHAALAYRFRVQLGLDALLRSVRS